MQVPAVVSSLVQKPGKSLNYIYKVQRLHRVRFNSMQMLSKGICRSSGEIRNAAELYCVLKTAVISSNAITVLATNCEAVEDNQYCSVHSSWHEHFDKLDFSRIL